jgi:hypothetical protein
MLENMNFREKKLYHQIHPFKLATAIGVTPLHSIRLGGSSSTGFACRPSAAASSVVCDI